MKRNHFFSKMWVILLIVLSSVEVTSQVLSSAVYSADTVEIGDPISVKIKVELPQGTVMKGLDFSKYRQITNRQYALDTLVMEKYGDIEIIDFGEWKHSDLNDPVPASSLHLTPENGRETIVNTITLAIYNAGAFAIPGPNVLIEKGDTTIINTEAKVVYVKLPSRLMKQDTVAFNPIKDIMPEKADLTDYMVYLYILGAIIIMAITGYYFYRLKKHKEAVLSPVLEIILPAHEKALLALRELESRQLWQCGMIKEYQSGLTDIIRQYLEDRFSIRAPEMTTDEISAALRGESLSDTDITMVREILQIADLVKFAKAVPEENIHIRFMDKAVAFVENTTKEVHTI